LAISELREALRLGRIHPALTSPAPYHDNPSLTGKVYLGSRFWAACWWYDTLLGDHTASQNWKAWLLQGGVVVPRDEIESLCFSVQRDRAIFAERLCRQNFGGLWLAVDAIAWIISRREDAIESLKSAISPLAPVEKLQLAWAGLQALAAESVADEIDKEERARKKADCILVGYTELSRALAAGKLRAWSWTPPATAPIELKAEDFFRAAHPFDSHSAGLLGPLDRTTFVLLRPDDIRAIWPAAGACDDVSQPTNDNSSRSEAEMHPASGLLTGDPGRPSKGYQLYVAEHRRRCDGGEAHTALAEEARHLLAWFLAEHPAASPPTVTTIENRIRSRHREFVNQTPQN